MDGGGTLRQAADGRKVHPLGAVDLGARLGRRQSRYGAGSPRPRTAQGIVRAPHRQGHSRAALGLGLMTRRTDFQSVPPSVDGMVRMSEALITSYEEIPYESKPLYPTHPD